MEHESYRLELKVKNNLFLQTIQSKGCATVGEAIRVFGLPASANHIANLKLSAYNKDGELRKPVKDVCEKLGCIVEDIIPEELMFDPLIKNKIEGYASAQQLKQLTSQNDDLSSTVDKLMISELFDEIGNVLTARESAVIKGRFEEGITLGEMGERLGVNRERIRQIEAKALRKLRNPNNKRIRDMGLVSEVCCVS